MAVDDLDEPEIEFAKQPDIALDAPQHGIDDQCLAAGAAGQQIGVGRGFGVEELAKDHIGVQTRPWQGAIPR